MKNATSEPEHLRDALASLPEPLDLQYLSAPRNRKGEQGGVLKRALEELRPDREPESCPRIC